MAEELVPQLSNDDRIVLESVLDESASLEVAIPADIGGAALWRNLETCCRIGGKFSRAVNKIRPVIGRLLVVLQDYPEVYQERGYRTYDEFMSVGMEAHFGISRTEAYALRAQMEKNPSLTPDEYNLIGPTKMAAMSKHITEGEHGYAEVKAKAMDRSVTKAQLRDYIAEVKGIPSNGTQLVDYEISCTKEQAEAIREFVTNKYIRLFVGSESPGTIITMAMAECLSPWVQQGMNLESAAEEQGIELEVIKE